VAHGPHVARQTIFVAREAFWTGPIPHRPSFSLFYYGMVSESVEHPPLTLKKILDTGLLTCVCGPPNTCQCSMWPAYTLNLEIPDLDHFFFLPGRLFLLQHFGRVAQVMQGVASKQGVAPRITGASHLEHR
jgi:hypothetical protein